MFEKQLLYLRNRRVVPICQPKRTSCLCCTSCKEDWALWRLELSRRRSRTATPRSFGSRRSRSSSCGPGCSPRSARCSESCWVRPGKTASFGISGSSCRRAGWRSRWRSNRIRVAANRSTSCFRGTSLWSSLFVCCFVVKIIHVSLKCSILILNFKFFENIY